LGCRFSFSLSICFSEKLLIEGDGLLVEIEGESKGRKGLSDCGADLRRLSDRGCRGGAEAVLTVGAGREWWFPMIGAARDNGTELENLGRGLILISIFIGEAGNAGGRNQDPEFARSNAFLL
jgi:hypothetical protein